MNYLLKKIILGPHFDEFSVFNVNDKKNSIENLSKINIFVGANNSGKSRFIRLLASEREMSFQPNFDLNEINTIRKALSRAIKDFCVVHRYEQIGGFGSLLSSFENDYDAFLEAAPLFNDVKTVFDTIYGTVAISYVVQSTQYQSLEKRVLQDLQEKISPIKNEFDKRTSKLPKQIKFQKMYMPAARSLRKYGDDIFRSRTMNEYFEFGGDNQKKYAAPTVFTGLDLYNEVTGLLLGDLKQRKLGLPSLLWVIFSIWEKGSQHFQPKILFILDAISPTLNHPDLVV